MRHIVAVHLEGLDHLEHIASLRWYETAGPNEPDTGALMVSTREQMFNFVSTTHNGAYALNKAKTHHAYLEAVRGSHVNYVKTVPDGTISDNLLSLPRY